MMQLRDRQGERQNDRYGVIEVEADVTDDQSGTAA